jgi:hypothetical protein
MQNLIKSSKKIAFETAVREGIEDGKAKRYF